MGSPTPHAPQGNIPAIGIPDSQDIPRLVYCAPYFQQVPLAELIEPSVIEAVEAALPALVPPYVQGAAETAVQQLAVLLTGSTMSGPLFLSPLMPTQPSQAATMAYVDSMIATAGIPEVPPVPSGQVWARETGQWVPITPQTGVFLPLSGGVMTGNINMSGNTIQNMAAVPAMPNGAAPAQWVLNQIASVSLYQGTWDADTNVPDLTQLSTHVNAYTWIALTTAPGGVVIGPAIPGLQGTTVFNGDTIIYSTVQGGFKAIHSGGITLPEADARYVQLAGSQMSGALLLNANASQPLQAVTLQQMQAFVPPGAVTEAPNDGQLYGRNGLTHAWSPVLPLAGGILTGALSLHGNATANLNPVPLQQMTSAISASVAGYLPLAGGNMSGLMSLSGNASANLNPVPLQQLTGMLASYLPLSGGTITGGLTVNGVFAAVQNMSIAGINIHNASGVLTVDAGIAANNVNVSGALLTNAAGSLTNLGGYTSGGPGGSGSGFVLFDRDNGSHDVIWFSASGSTNLFAQPEAKTLTSIRFSDGACFNTTGSWVVFSDPQVKTATADYSTGIAAVRQLSPIAFRYNGEHGMPLDDESVTRYGLDASAVEPIMPEMVSRHALPDPEMDGTHDELLTIDTGPLIYALVNAAKELVARVEALEAGRTA